MTDDLTLIEIRRLVTAFAMLGTEKIRLTGGEPTLRRDLNEIIRTCKSVPGIKSVALTTNGFRLEKDVASWREAGLDALNVSVDSLRPEMFQLITGSGKLQSILQGLEQAQSLGFQQVKINTVLLREQNARELDSFLDFIKTRNLTLRFIELMQTGDNVDFFARQHLSAESIRQRLLADGWTQKLRSINAGPAKEYNHPDYKGSIGLIMPYSQDFCASCNRLRVSSQAELYLCLFAEQHLSFRNLLQSDDPQPVIQFLQQAIIHKTAGHNLHQQQTGSTKQLAMIGG
jgi:cyclic pyranopterin phosphate synthase